MPLAAETLRALEPTLDALDDPVVVTTADVAAPGPRVVFVNRAFTRLTGYAPDDILGRAPPVGFDGDGLSFGRIGDDLFIRGRFRGAATVHGKHGDTHPVEVQIAPILDGCGGIGHWLSIHRVVDSRHLASGGCPIEEGHRRSYCQVVESQPDLIGCFLPDTTLTFVNAAYAAFFGRPALDLIGRRFIDFVPAEDRPVIRTNLASVTPDEPSRRYERKATRADGEVRWHLWNDLALFDDSGILVSFQSVGSDITERKRAEQALADSKERFRALMESTSDWVWEIGVDGTYTYVSTKVRGILGYEPDEVLGRTPFDLMPPRKAERAAAIFGAIAARGESFAALEYVGIHKDGRRVVLESSGVPILSADGAVAGYRGIDRDITGRKRAEEALFAEKERAEVTLHSIGDAVITTGADGIVDYLNPVAEALTGWSCNDAKGRQLGEVFRIIEEETREPVENPLVRCLEEGRAVGLATHAVLVGRGGQEHPIEDSVAPIRGRDGRVLGAVMVFHDVTETRRMARQMAHEATHDALTGLVNRREFERRLERALASAKQYGSRHALCYLDLDQFKLVNDTAGHTAGDAMLKQVRGLLAGKFRERDTLARLGGDEFGLLLDNCSLQEALKISDIIVAAFHECRFAWQGRVFDIGVSIGIVPVTADAESAAQLLVQADVACYSAKEQGPNRVHVYRREGSEPPGSHIEVLRAANLRDALDQDRFRLYCQPIVPLSADSDVPIRFEFLLRLLDSDGELIWPRAFIPAAERYGLMPVIDRWVIRTAFRHFTRKIANSSLAEIAINLSGNSLDDHSLLPFVREQFAEFGLPPDRVCFEITETAAFHNFGQTSAFVSGIKESGSRLALDNFGRGMSSFTFLKSFPVDYLKIDGAYVRDMMVSAVDHDLVEAINQVGHVMGIKTIAEYAHSSAIVERLKELGVDCAQGDAIGLPVPLPDVASLLLPAVH